MDEEVVDHGREPCPGRILDDVGGAFAMGAIGGAVWHSVKGAKNSPRGERFTGAVTAMKTRAPILGGNFAVWGGMFSAFDCSLAAVRKKEDAWNAITSGALTSGCLALRGGPKTVMVSAAIGGAMLAMFEGIGLAFRKMMSAQNKPVRPVVEAPMPPPPSSPAPSPSASSSAFAGAETAAV